MKGLNNLIGTWLVDSCHYISSIELLLWHFSVMYATGDNQKVPKLNGVMKKIFYTVY